MNTAHALACRAMLGAAVALACLPAAAGPAPGPFRLWTDATGDYSVDAALLEHDGVTILVRQRDGARVRLVVAQLSEADREYLRGIDERPPADAPEPPPQRVPGPGRKRLPDDRLPYDRLVAWAEPAVARIETDLGRGNRGGGSGFFVDCNHLVTSFHVIDGAQGAVVVSGDERYPVKGNSPRSASRGQGNSGGNHRHPAEGHAIHAIPARFHSRFRFRGHPIPGTRTDIDTLGKIRSFGGMPRVARLVVPGLPHHVTQRGNRRQQTFFCDDDYAVYIELMVKWCHERRVEVWAYCLMPNYVHLIVVPSSEEALAQAIGEAHRRYTRRINFREKWRG